MNIIKTELIGNKNISFSMRKKRNKLIYNFSVLCFFLSTNSI